MTLFMRVLVVLTAFFGALLMGTFVPVLARPDVWGSIVWRHPWALLLFALIPFLLVAATFVADLRTPRLKFPTLAVLARGPLGWRASVRDVPGALRAAALAFAVVALARPQNVLRTSEAEERGIDIVVVLDLSESMRAVMDAPVTTPLQGKRGMRPTRLDVAKDTIRDFIQRRKNDRIGVVVFGVSAFVLSPPTLDYSLVNTLVAGVAIEDLNGAGTAIGDAVGTAVARLRRSNARSKVVILLTDGDSNAGSISPEYSIDLAKTQGVHVYTVQIGNGDEVDVFSGLDLFGQPQYRRARFPVNPELLKTMAQQTGGEAFVATDRAGLEQSMHTILDRLEKTKLANASSSYEELFPFFLVPACVWLVVEVLLRLLVVRRFP